MVIYGLKDYNFSILFSHDCIPRRGIIRKKISSWKGHFSEPEFDPFGRFHPFRWNDSYFGRFGLFGQIFAVLPMLFG